MRARFGSPEWLAHEASGLGEAALLRNVDAADSTGERCANYGNSAACAAPCVVVSVPAEAYAAALRPRHLELVEHLAHSTLSRLSAIPAKQRAVMHTDELLRIATEILTPLVKEKQSRDDARRGLVRR